MLLPKLTVILANYNHGHYIGSQLSALLSQFYKPIEIIVIDDASTDNSIEVIESYAAKDSRIKLLRCEVNRGAIACANWALQESSGDYIYWAAADDQVLPNLFIKSMSLLIQYPKAGLCCSHPAFLDANTNQLDLHEDWYHHGVRPCYLSPQELINVLPDIWIAGYTAIMRKEALIKAGGFIPELKWHSDWFALYVIAFRWGICYTPEPLASQRVLPNSFSSSGMKDPQQQQEVVEYLAKLLNSAEFEDVRSPLIESNVLRVFFPDHLQILGMD